MNNLIGLVICGGKSSRMGTDKGLIPIGETIWSKKQASLLSQFSDKVLTSINANQTNAYKAHFSEESLVLDNEIFNNIAGPFVGLLSAHIKFPQTDFLILACDYPYMEGSVIKKIIAKSGGNKIVVVQEEGQIHPLIGFYPSGEINKIKQLFDNGNLADRSIRSVLKELGIMTIEIAPCEALKNINRKED